MWKTELFGFVCVVCIVLSITFFDEYKINKNKLVLFKAIGMALLFVGSLTTVIVLFIT